MNWPDRDLPPKVLENLDAKIELFMSQKTALDNEEGMSKVKKFSVDLYKIYVGKNDLRTEEELLAKGEKWDTDEPKLTHIQKFINRLMSDKLQEASDYFENAAKYAELINSEAVFNSRRKSAKASADKKHRGNNRIKADAIAYYLKNRETFVTKGDAARKLEKRFPPLSYRTYYDALKGK